jgi:hypothetical protein
MNLDAMCLVALARVYALIDLRIERYRRENDLQHAAWQAWVKRQHDYLARSFGQEARYRRLRYGFYERTE